MEDRRVERRDDGTTGQQDNGTRVENGKRKAEVGVGKKMEAKIY